MTYSFLSYKSATSFFKFVKFHGKRVNHCEDHVTFEDVEHQFQKIYPSSFSSSYIFMKYSLSCISNPFKTISEQILWHCSSVKTTHVPKLQIRRSLFLS